MSSTRLRGARPEDVAECVRLRGMTRENAVSAERLAALGITVESWAAQVARGELVGWVGMRGDAMLGYCFGHVGTGEVVVLALLPEAEGRGLGKALLLRVMQALQSQGHERLYLGCARDPSTRSHGFYRHLGWVPTGEVDAHDDEVLEWVARAARA